MFKKMLLLSLVVVGLAFPAISAGAGYVGQCGALYLGRGNDVSWQNYYAGDEHIEMRTCSHEGSNRLYIDVRNIQTYPICVTFIRHTDMRKELEALGPNESTYFFTREKYDAWQVHAIEKARGRCR